MSSLLCRSVEGTQGIKYSTTELTPQALGFVRQGFTL
jgi:hypothetical protein